MKDELELTRREFVRAAALVSAAAAVERGVGLTGLRLARRSRPV